MKNINLPNKLTFLRILLIPFIIFLYLTDFMPYKEIICGLIFLVGIFTDYLDGNIARKNNLITDLGKLMDPIADKLLVFSALLLLTLDLTIPNPYGIIIIFILLARDFLVSAIRQMCAIKGVAHAANKWGKFKTLFTDISIIFLFILAYINNNALTFNGFVIFEIFTYSLLAISVILTVVSGAIYFLQNKHLIATK